MFYGFYDGKAVDPLISGGTTCPPSRALANARFPTENMCVFYSTNFDAPAVAHCRDRFFTNWIEKNKPEWKLVKFVKQKCPRDQKATDAPDTSNCNFYFYELSSS